MLCTVRPTVVKGKAIKQNAMKALTQHWEGSDRCKKNQGLMVRRAVTNLVEMLPLLLAKNKKTSA